MQYKDPNTPVDFEDSIDLLELKKLTFSQPTVTRATGRQSQDTLINHAQSGELLAVLTGVQAITWSSVDFITLG